MKNAVRLIKTLFVFSLSLCLSVSVLHLFFPSLSKQGHQEQRDQPALAGELHGHRGPPEDPAHVQDQARRFPGPQLPQAAGGDRLPAAVPRLWHGEPHRPLPQPDGDPGQQPVLQLRAGAVRDATAEGDRPAQPHEHHAGRRAHREEPGPLLPVHAGLGQDPGHGGGQLHRGQQERPRVWGRVPRGGQGEDHLPGDHHQRALQRALLDTEALSKK